MEQGKNISVLYLMWLPYGFDYFRRFVESYEQQEAGEAHQLLILLNGTGAGYDTRPYTHYIEEKGLVCRVLTMESGQDIEAYFYGASQVESDYILFLNTYTQFCTKNWLRNYVAAFADERVGLVSASASNQSYYSSVFQKNRWGWDSKAGVGANYRKYKLFVKAFFYWRWLFPAFPNPHVRTSAFMLRRDLLLRLPQPKRLTKFDAYLFESGRKSLTRSIQKMGYRVLVVDKKGQTYIPPNWKGSNTFWVGEQENLLISDNQTRLYTDVGTEEKKEMTRLAWGKDA